jgi:hypothetical protein
MIPRPLACLVVVVLLAACSAAGPSPAPSPSTPPTSTPTSTPTMVPTPTADPTTKPRTPPPMPSVEPTVTPTLPPSGLMTVTVLPVEVPPEVRPAIPGERICFLVLVDDRFADDGAISIAATGDGVTIDSVPSVPPPRQVGELWVTVGPHEGEVEKIVTVEVTVTHGGDDPVEWVETRSIIVVPDTDSRAEIAEQYFDFWVEWLATEHPELGIDETVEWESTIVSMLWIVSKYAYWSDEWEMVVAWHEMVPPDDFTEVYLRRRDDEVRYSLVFRQDSFSEQSEPQQISPPADLIR